jgi:hypothetical protein
VALLEKRRFLYNHSGDFPQVILIVPSHVPNTTEFLLGILPATTPTNIWGRRIPVPVSM